jgi:hypothetical protein
MRRNLHARLAIFAGQEHNSVGPQDRLRCQEDAELLAVVHVTILP